MFQIGRAGKVPEHNCGRIHPCADLGEDSPGMKTTVQRPELTAQGSGIGSVWLGQK